jgi:hypothetical protein
VEHGCTACRVPTVVELAVVDRPVEYRCPHCVHCSVVARVRCPHRGHALLGKVGWGCIVVDAYPGFAGGVPEVAFMSASYAWRAWALVAELAGDEVIARPNAFLARPRHSSFSHNRPMAT